MKWLNENPEKADELEARLRAELVANPEQALMADIDNLKIVQNQKVILNKSNHQRQKCGHF